MIAPRYTVLWAPEVEEGLAEYWIEADPAERERLTQAIHLIDRGLSISPELKGGPAEFEPDFRVWDLPRADPPVRAAFEVSTDDRRVRVLRPTLYGRRFDRH